MLLNEAYLVIKRLHGELTLHVGEEWFIQRELDIPDLLRRLKLAALIPGDHVQVDREALVAWYSENGYEPEINPSEIQYFSVRNVPTETSGDAYLLRGEDSAHIFICPSKFIQF